MIARDSITSEITTYMMPIFLWSRLVSHPNQNGFHSLNQNSREVTVIAPSTTRDAAKVAMML